MAEDTAAQGQTSQTEAPAPAPPPLYPSMVREPEPATQPPAAEQALPAEQQQPDEAQSEQVEASEPEQQRFPVRVDGRELQVTLDELTRGYQRLSDYTRKTQGLADERRQIEAQRAEIDRLRQDYEQRLARIATTPGQQEQEPDWLKLADEDPAGYVRERAKWEQRQRAQAELVQMQQARLADQLKVEQAKMIETVPEWRDPEKAKADTALMRRIGTEVYGFSPDELATVYDHRLARVLRDAALYRQSLTAKPKPQPTPQPQPALRPGTQPSPQPASQPARSLYPTMAAHKFGLNARSG